MEKNYCVFCHGKSHTGIEVHGSVNKPCDWTVVDVSMEKNQLRIQSWQNIEVHSSVNINKPCDWVQRAQV